MCDGTELLISDYNILYNLIGTTYGGDGETTFALPNLKGKVIVGYNPDDTDFSTPGITGGEKVHTLTTDEMPSHTHTQAQHRHSYTDTSTSTQCSVGYSSTDPKSSNTTSTKYTSYQTPTINNTGGGGSHNNLQPYTVMTYLIRVS